MAEKNDDKGLGKVQYEDQIARHLKEKYGMIEKIMAMSCTDILKQDMIRALQEDSCNYALKG